MIGADDVNSFLKQFNIKAQVFGILFRDDRPKNRETLLQLEITPLQREVIVKSLQVEDYVEGPVIDELNRRSEMWVFGKYKIRSMTTQSHGQKSSKFFGV